MSTEDGQKSNMNLLSRKYSEHCTAPFPEIGDEPHEIQHFHGDLALYDAEVGGMISQVVKGKKLWKRYSRNPRLLARLSNLRRKYPDRSTLLDAYEQRYLALQGLIDLAEQVARKPEHLPT